MLNELDRISGSKYLENSHKTKINPKPQYPAQYLKSASQHLPANICQPSYVISCSASRCIPKLPLYPLLALLRPVVPSLLTYGDAADLLYRRGAPMERYNQPVGPTFSCLITFL